jgi:hypothetical protein
MKTIEMGMPLPEVEVARAKAEEVRAKAEAAKAIVLVIMRTLVQVGTFGIAIGATAVLLRQADQSLHLVGLLVIWICAALASMTAMLTTVLESRRWNLRGLFPPSPPTPSLVDEERLMTAIQK